MTHVLTWGTGTRSGVAARRLPVETFSATVGSVRSAYDFPFGGKRLPLFTSVRLVRPLRAEGEALPVDASGTVVEVLDGGRAYVVEFFRPHHCVMTVYDRDLAVQTT